MQRRTALQLAASMAATLALRTTRANPAFDDWAERFASEWVRLSPERATFTQYLGGAEQAELDGKLSSAGPAQRERQVTLARAGLAQLDRWLGSDLTDMQRIGALTMRWGLQRTVDGAPFADHYFNFNQNSGVHVRQVGLLTESQPLRRSGDVEAFLSRLAAMPQQMDEAIERSRAAARRQLMPPRFIVERVRPQVQALLAQAAADSDIVTALARRLALLADVSAEARADTVARARKLVADGMRPAWQRLLAWLDELHPRTVDAAGFARLPDGARAYEQALRENTTTTLTAEEIHAIGLREVARLEGEMDALLRQLDLKDGSVNERLRALNLKLQPPAEPDPRPMLIARYHEMVRDAERRSAGLFKLRPKTPVDVRRVPALTERTASAYYTTPAPDGSRPGVFWVPMPGPNFGMLGMRTLAVHEAVPGHHFQLALQQEMMELPRWRRLRLFGGGSAHSEGWGLYAEKLALEQGWYEGDAHGQLGALNSLLFRARRLVVDTGLHVKGWTRQQAIDYGISPSEVERYVVNPGQACAYMIGMQRIVALREEARQALGARFSLPEFHDVVLRTGSVPLEVLGEVVKGWVARQRSA